MLEWIFRRCDGEAEAVETPIGLVPGAERPRHRRPRHRRRRARGAADRRPRRGARRARRRSASTWRSSATSLPGADPRAVRGAQGAPGRKLQRVSLAEETEAGSGRVPDRLLELIDAARAAGARPPCARSRRRTCAGSRPTHRRRSRAEAPRGRGARRVRASPPRAARSRWRCARSTRRSTSDGYEPLGSVLETNTDDWPFLVDSVSAALERARRAGRAARAPDHRRSRATRRARSPASRTPRDAIAPRVGHALRPRAPARPTRELAELEADGRATCCSPSAATVTRLRGDDRSASTAMIELARDGSARYDADEVDETVDFLDWLLRGNFVFLGSREYELTDDAYRVRPRLRARHPRRRGALHLREAGPARRRCRRGVRDAALDGRPADRRQDQRALAGAPARADGLRRRAARHAPTARSSARRACSACSRPRPTPSRRPRRRCCTASCGACSRPRT